MSSDENDEKGSSEGDGGHRKSTRIRHFRGYWNLENTKHWVGMLRDDHIPIEDTAYKEGADPATVSKWIKENGYSVPQGHHFVPREPPKVSLELAKLLGEGPEATLKFLDERTWGISASEAGLKQLTKFCSSSSCL
jgi:hypothetical protein